jgi:restriction endonuclease S subunit
MEVFKLSKLEQNVSLICDDGAVYANSIILSAASGYFKVRINKKKFTPFYLRAKFFTSEFSRQNHRKSLCSE